MAVNKVEAFGVTLIDLTADTVTAETLAEGVTAHNAQGELITGTMSIKQPYKIGAVADFTTNTLSGITVTFSEVESAIANGDLIYMEVDISQMIPGQKVYTLTSGYLTGNYAVFEQPIQMQDGIYHMVCYFFANDIGNFTLTKLATA